MNILAFLVLMFVGNSLGIPPSSKYNNQFGGILKGFSNVFCRMRHYRVLLNEYNQSVGCLKKCPFSFQERYSLYWGHYCRHAECLIKNCISCKTATVCSKCKPGYFLSQVTKQTTICVKTCPENTIMTFQSAPRCELVEAESKTKFPTQTKITNDEKKLDTKVVQVFAEGCLDQQCSSCADKYYKFVLPNAASLCFKKCPVGYNAIGKVCLACSDLRCASCKSSLVECDRCHPPYHLLLDSYNTSQECVRTCPADYIIQEINGTTYCTKSSKSECPVANCDRCTSSDLHSFHRGCVECAIGFVLYRGTFNDHCYATCPSGYYKEINAPTNATVCARCQTDFCKTCSSFTSCEECIEPLVLDFATRKCQLCPSKKQYSFKYKRCIPAEIDNVSEYGRNNVLEN